MQLQLLSLSVALPLVLGLAPAGGADDAVRDAEQALELAPDDAELLIAAADAWLTVDGPEARDMAAWYATLAREANGTDSPDAAVERGVLRVFETLEVPDVELVTSIGDHSRRLFVLAEACRKRKLYANAAELLGRLEGTRFERQGMEKLATIFKKEAVVAQLLSVGIEVPPRVDPDADPVKTARLNARHRDWDKAWEIKSKNYTVRTNLDRDMAQRVSQAMEQINVYYRRIFGMKRSGGGMQRCLVEVYRHRSEFDEHEGTGDRPTLGGFYVPGENRVATFDGTSIGMSVDDLWETLFHEASHQFTSAIWKQDIPTWLDEGTASYFEGARILTGGAVVANGIPDSRLRSLVLLQGRGSPTLSEVINHFEPGSYPGAYYPFGWGLVYFFHNYEDADGERVYRKWFEKYRDAYQGAGKHDVEEWFVDYFVKKPRQEGVSTLEEFDERFQSWMRDLHRVHFGGAEQAEVLLERARRQRAQGHLENAAESYRWALEKRSDHAAALEELGAVLVELKRTDAAVYRFRSLLELARSASSPEERLHGIDDRTAGEVAATAQASLVDVERGIADLIAALGEGLPEVARSSIQALVEAGFPRKALVHLEEASALLGRPRTFVELTADVTERTGVDVWRWRTVPITKGLPAWDADPSFRVEDGRLVGKAGGSMSKAVSPLRPRRDFHLEVQAAVLEEGRVPMITLVLGSGGRERHVSFQVSSPGLAMLYGKDDEDPDAGAPPLGLPASTDWKDVTLGVTVRDREVTVHADGKALGTWPIGPRDMRGRVGVMVQGATVAFRNLRVRD